MFVHNQKNWYQHKNVDMDWCTCMCVMRWTEWALAPRLWIPDINAYNNELTNAINDQYLHHAATETAHMGWSTKDIPIIDDKRGQRLRWCQLLRVGTQTTSQPGAHLFSLRLSYRGIGSSSRSLMSQLASASCNRNTHNVRRRADIAPSRTQILPWHCLYLAANIVLICKGRECK